MDSFNPFSFQTVPRLLCEIGGAQKLGKLVREQFAGISHALIVTDPGFLKTGLVDPLIASLRAENFQVSVYADVVADPPEAIVLQAAAAAHRDKIDLVIGLGGGSSMDVAKLIAVLLGSEQELKTMYGIGNVKGARLPLILSGGCDGRTPAPPLLIARLNVSG